MIKQSDKESLERLRQLLLKTKAWPLKYMFKFIVPNSDDKVNRVVAVLPEGGSQSFKPSKELHYVAVTCIASMSSADEIIDVVERAIEIEGVISL